MKNKAKILVTVVVVLVIIFIGSLNKPTASQEIKIGVIATLTGPGAYFGEQFVNGLRLAQDDLNTRGGIMGRSVKLIIEDSKTDNTTALTVAKKLVETDGVSIILGDSWNGTTQTFLPYTNGKKIIVFSPNASLDEFSRDDYLFRMVPKTSDFVKPLARYVADKGIKTIAFARAKSSFGDEHYNDFKAEFERSGGRIVQDEQFDLKATDVRTELTRIKSNSPEMIFDLHASGPAIGLLISQVNQLGIHSKYIGTWTVENSALLKQYPKEIEGIIYPFMYDESESTTSKYFADAVRSKGKTADFFIASGYDILNVVAVAIEKADGISNTDKIKGALLGIKDYDGTSGRFGFDSNGDVTRNIFIKTVKDGKFVKAN